MTQMFETFIEPRECGNKAEMVAQSKGGREGDEEEMRGRRERGRERERVGGKIFKISRTLRRCMQHSYLSLTSCTGTFERHNIPELRERCMEIEM